MFYRLYPFMVFAAVLVIGIMPALAQEPARTNVTLMELLAPWLPMLIGAFMTLILALLGAMTAYIKKRFDLEESVAFRTFERNFRDALQSALTNAAGRAVLVLGDKLRDVKLDARLPEIRQAILQVNVGASEAVAHFKLSEEDLANMIINKIGVVTAANPVVVPTIDPAAPPKPGTPA